MIARYFGASFISDSFFVAFKLPNLFRRLFAEGALNAAFIPVISGIKVKHGDQDAVMFLSKIFSLVLLLIFPLILIFEILMPFVIIGMAPGFQSDMSKFNLTVQLSRLTFPFLLFVSLSSLLGSFLNTMNKFAAMAFTPVILNLIIITTFLTFGTKSGNALILSIYVASSISIAGVVQLLWLIFNLNREGIFLRIKHIFTLKIFQIDNYTKKLLYLFIPAVVGNGVYQINLLIDMILASTLRDGSISFLYFSDRIVQLPLGVLGISLSTALLPTISKFIKQNKYNDANKTANFCLQLGFFFSIPASFGLFLLSDQILDLLFVRGEFSAYDAQSTAQSLRAFCIGLPAFILIKIFSVLFFSREDTKIPVLIAFLSMVVNLCFNLILIDKFFHVGLAMATSIAAWFNAMILGMILVKKNFLIIKVQTLKIFLKGLTCSIFMFLVIKYMNYTKVISYVNQAQFLEKFVVLFGNLLLGVLIYLILMYLFKSLYLINPKRHNYK